MIYISASSYWSGGGGGGPGGGGGGDPVEKDGGGGGGEEVDGGGGGGDPVDEGGELYGADPNDMDCFLYEPNSFWALESLCLLESTEATILTLVKSSVSGGSKVCTSFCGIG